MDLKGKVALITGSTSEGMGRSTALTLAARGADIVLNYGTNRSDEEADQKARQVEKAIHDLGRRVITVKADTKSGDEVSAMVKKAHEEFGRVDILVLNAGGDWHVRDYPDTPDDHWEKVIAAEITGAFLPMKYIVPGMRERSWGRIILLGMYHDPYLKEVALDYCVGKAARAYMTTAFWLPDFDKGITINCIEPGLTQKMHMTDALKAAKGDHVNWLARKKVNAHDVAEIIAFLCSEAGRFVSGSIIRIPTR
ncbi:MAG: SDR family oxidoreductase [bacterium]